MAEQPSDNLSSSTAGTATGSSETPTGTAEKHMTWSQKRAYHVSSIIADEFAKVSVDTFATPSEGPENGNAPLAGTEPAVFGGVNPSPDEPSIEGAELALEGGVESIADALTADEAIRTEELLAGARRINFAKIAKSTWFLITMMVLCLIAGSMLVDSQVKTITYVQMTVPFINYQKLNELEKESLQTEIAQLVRSFPLRQKAWDTVKKNNPDLSLGFLGNGLTFHRLDAISWENDGRMVLRVDSIDPSDDLIRLRAVADAFYSLSQDRSRIVDKNNKDLADAQKLQIELLQRDAVLKQQAEALLPDAQRYTDLKVALQATQRYLELADESNPLRLVARQNLRRLTAQVAEARGASERHDDLLAKRVEIQRQVDDTQARIVALRRALDSFSYPQAPDPKSVQIVDTRDHRRAIQRNVWFVIIAVFVGIFAAIHYIDYRTAETQRRERRLKRQMKAASNG